MIIDPTNWKLPDSPLQAPDHRRLFIFSKFSCNDKVGNLFALLVMNFNYFLKFAHYCLLSNGSPIIGLFIISNVKNLK